MTKPYISWPRPHRTNCGMTLVEVMVAMGVLGLVFAGVLTSLLQSRRLTDGSVAQNSALATVQSYMEQMRCMSQANLTNNSSTGIAPAGSYSIPTQRDDSGNVDALLTSTGTPPDISTLTPGTTPTGGAVADNLKDIITDPNQANWGGTTTWDTPTGVWPNASYPAAKNNASVPNVPVGNTFPYTKHLHLNIWVWITNITPTAAKQYMCYGITMYYTWSFWDGYANHYYTGTIRSIRSAIPTFE